MEDDAALKNSGGERRWKKLYTDKRAVGRKDGGRKRMEISSAVNYLRPNPGRERSWPRMMRHGSPVQ